MIANKICRFALAVSAVIASVAPRCFADESAISTTELNRHGDHFGALVAYEQDRSRARLADTIAAGNSAWALNLADQAEDLWNDALRNPAFQGDERTKTQFSLAILHFQEGRYEEARALAERSLRKLPQSDLRTQFLLLIGESLSAQKAYSLAQSYYERAAAESSPALHSETSFLLGRCQRTLGLVDEARKSFTGVETDSTYGSAALAELMRIDFQERRYDGVKIWFNQGVQRYAQEFADPQARYMMITALLNLKENEQAKEALNDFGVQFNADNPWFILAKSAYEADAFVPPSAFEENHEKRRSR